MVIRRCMISEMPEECDEEHCEHYPCNWCTEIEHLEYKLKKLRKKEYK